MWWRRRKYHGGSGDEQEYQESRQDPSPRRCRWLSEVSSIGGRLHRGSGAGAGGVVASGRRSARAARARRDRSAGSLRGRGSSGGGFGVFDNGDGARGTGVEITLEALQIGAHLGSVLVAQVAIFFERLVDDVLKLERQVGIQADRHQGSAIQDGVEDHAGSVAAKGREPGSHFVEDDAEGEKIGAGIEVLAPHLLGRHVGDGAEGRSGTGKVLRADGAGGLRVLGITATAAHEFGGKLGEAEIENLHVTALGDEDVAGFNVAMNDAFGMGGVEAVGNLNCEADQGLGVERTAGNHGAQSKAVEELHDEVRVTFLFGDLVNGADVGMVQGRGGAGLAAKAFERLRVVGKFVRQEFERDEAAELQIFGLVDDAHPTATESFEDTVMRDGPANHGDGGAHPMAAILGGAGRASQRGWAALQPLGAGRFALGARRPAA